MAEYSETVTQSSTAAYIRGLAAQHQVTYVQTRSDLLAQHMTRLADDAVQPAAPAGIMIDDGYTFFRLRGKKDYVDGKPIDMGWSLLSYLRVVGPSIPQHSSFKIVVSNASVWSLF